MALALHPSAWYIVAWDLDKDALRIFRMDRISTPGHGEILECQHSLDKLLTQTTPEKESESIRRSWVRTPLGCSHPWLDALL